MQAGDVFEVNAPFIRDRYVEYDEDGRHGYLSWRPGVVWEVVGPEGEADMRAHGVGKVRYTVISVHKLPRPYPARVFFTRKWISPDGREFGKPRLHVLTLDAFRRRTVSYRPAGSDFHTQLVVQDLDDDERREALETV